MQTFAVFVAVLAAASATTITESHRVGGNFAYSTSDVGYGVVGTQPVVHHQKQVVSPATTYTTLSGYPATYSTYHGVPVSTYNNWNTVPVSTYNNWNTVPVVANTNTLGNVVYAKSAVQQAYVPATSVVQAGTPANTYKHVAGVSPLSTVGAYPYSTIVY